MRYSLFFFFLIFLTDISESSVLSQKTNKEECFAENFDAQNNREHLECQVEEGKVCIESQKKCDELKQKTETSLSLQETLLQINHPAVVASTALLGILPASHKNADDDTVEVGDILAAATSGEVGEALKMAFTWFFQDDETKGLGFSLSKKGKQAIYAADPEISIAHLKRINEKAKTNTEWETKLQTSVLKSRFEHSLFQKGFTQGEKVRKKYSVESKSENAYIQVSGGSSKTVAELIGEYFPNNDAQEILLHLGSDNNKKKVLGALDLNAEIPDGAYIYFSPEGYPIFVSENSEEKPEISLYFKDEELENSQQENNPDDTPSKVKYLQSTLQVGDILHLNEKDDKKNLAKKSILKVARLAQEDDGSTKNFHSIHTAVYLGNGEISHIRKKGLMNDDLGIKVMNLEAVFNRYSAVSASRLDLDKQSREDFAEKTKEYIDDATSYNSERATQVGLQGLSTMSELSGVSGLLGAEKEELAESPTSMICTDPLMLAARDLLSDSDTSKEEKAEFEKLTGINMALDIFKAFANPVSMNVSLHMPAQNDDE